jgi:4-oxalocrotonate tautomerase
MPLIDVSVAGHSDAALSASIAHELSALTATHLHKDPAVTAIAISYVMPENWFVGGTPLADLGRKSFSLDIKVTAGTNTKLEMASYIEAVFHAMGRVVGALHDTSYIIVHEVPAAAWGFAGTTQEYRFVAGRISKAA